ncbi:MAG: hypothetical protein GXO00_01675 [Candidatus Diapherotrites archaeon]|nr:hypothetical protein [Candidatus Diapherotrites archaeon]
MVVFKEGTALHRALQPLLEYLEEEELRGLGKVHAYFEGTSAYFVPLKRDFSLAGREEERRIVSAIGGHVDVVSLREGDRLSLYPTGNPTRSNPLLIDSYTPRSLSPVDPDLLGTLWLALRKKDLNPSLLAVHDPPSNLQRPHVAVELPLNKVEELFFALLASFRKKKTFVPHLTVSRGFEASYFYPLIERRRVPAYHLPYFWVQFLDRELFEQAQRKGGVRSILVEKGLVLPGELPYKEV